MDYDLSIYVDKKLLVKFTCVSDDWIDEACLSIVRSWPDSSVVDFVISFSEVKL